MADTIGGVFLVSRDQAPVCSARQLLLKVRRRRL